MKHAAVAVVVFLILALFSVQSIWGIVDSMRPENPVSQSLKDSGAYKFIGGQHSDIQGSGTADGTPDAPVQPNVDTGGIVFGIVTLLLTIGLGVFFGLAYGSIVDLSKFNPFE
jgi:hypothetical protein